MLSREDLEKIKNIVREFFQKTALDIDVDFLPEKEGVLPIQIKTEEPQILIGEGGQTLSDIQRLLKIILRRKIETNFYIDLDINDYKKRKIEYLKELAKNTADEVALTKQEKQLPAMTAYERRVVHLELAERQDITTESIGQEPEIRLVIKPRP
mgnify:CR=1 FL=1